MDDRLQLTVLTPTGTVVDQPVAELSAPGVLGEFGVLPAHTPLLAALTGGLLAFTADNVRTVLAIRRGFAEVNNDRVVVLTEGVVRPADIDHADLDRQESELHLRVQELMDRGESHDAVDEDLNFLATLRALAARHEASS